MARKDREEIARLCAALAPFADLAINGDPSDVISLWAPGDEYVGDLTVGDFQRAMAVLRGH